MVIRHHNCAQVQWKKCGNTTTANADKEWKKAFNLLFLFTRVLPESLGPRPQAWLLGTALGRLGTFK
jgi:hypothetical protein